MTEHPDYEVRRSDAGMPAAPVVVTGARRGIGAAVVAQLRDAGWRTVGVDRVADDAGFVDVIADLSRPEGREHAVESVAARSGGGPLAGLVACAGVSAFAGADGADVVSINFFGAAGLAESLRQHAGFEEESSVAVIGSIVATTSPLIDEAMVGACLANDEEAARAAGIESGAGLAYASSKLALARWARCHSLDAEWLGAGIHVNVVAPGVTETGLLEEMRRDPDGARSLAAYPVPLGRFGRPDEIAGVIEFLFSPRARLFVGAVITADGGAEAQVRPDWPSSRRSSK